MPWQPHDADAAAEAHLKSLITVAFAKFDVNGDGILDVSETGKALTELTTGKDGRDVNTNEVLTILEKYDVDRSGTIGLRETTAMVRDLANDGRLDLCEDLDQEIRRVRADAGVRRAASAAAASVASAAPRTAASIAPRNAPPRCRRAHAAAFRVASRRATQVAAAQDDDPWATALRGDPQVHHIIRRRSGRPGPARAVPLAQRLARTETRVELPFAAVEPETAAGRRQQAESAAGRVCRRWRQ